MHTLPPTCHTPAHVPHTLSSTWQGRLGKLTDDARGVLGAIGEISRDLGEIGTSPMSAVLGGRLGKLSQMTGSLSSIGSKLYTSDK